MIIIRVSNPTAFSGKGSLILLEYMDEEAALKVARKSLERPASRYGARREEPIDRFDIARDDPLKFSVKPLS